MRICYRLMSSLSLTLPLQNESQEQPRAVQEERCAGTRHPKAGADARRASEWIRELLLDLSNHRELRLRTSRKGQSRT